MDVSNYDKIESNGFVKDADIVRKAEDYRNQLLVERLTEVEVDEKITYTEQELIDYYEANKAEYVDEETVQATCISLVDETKAEEAKAEEPEVEEKDKEDESEDKKISEK